MRANKGEWSEPYVALRVLGDGKLNLADDEGNVIPDQWLNVLDVIRYETRERVDQRVEYGLSADAIVDIKIDDKEIASVPAHEFLYYADKLKAEILNASGSSFNVSEDIEKFFEKIQLTAIKAKSIDKSDIFISIEDTQTSVVRRHIVFSIKSKFGKDPTLFNTGKNSATVYKLSNMNDDLMDEINSMVDEKNHTAVADRCKALLENGCEFEFVGFPVAARAGCKTFEENLDILNPRLGDTIDYILRTHFLTDETARDVEDMVDIVIEHNPCSLTRPKEKYQYMMKSFLYASYCGLTAGTLWDGKSQVNGGFIAVDEKGNVTANLALESEGFKSYLFKHCYFEWPATSENHGNYAKVYKEGEDYYFRLNFQIRYR